MTDFSNYEHPDSKKSELSSKVTAHSAVTVSQSRTVISSIQMKNSVDFEPLHTKALLNDASIVLLGCP